MAPARGAHDREEDSRERNGGGVGAARDRRSLARYPLVTGLAQRLPKGTIGPKLAGRAGRRPSPAARLRPDPTSAYPRSMAGSVRTDAVRDLIGREAESELIATVVDRLQVGGGALVLRGEPGIGKSALLRLARERAEAAGSRTLTTVGVESEAEFAFAGLHQLLHPVIGHAARLPAAQRRALDTAFGASEEVEPDSYRVALATFQLMCEAAETGPIVLIVDDAHWLDRPTLAALAFVARRLDSEPLAMVRQARRRRREPGFPRRRPARTAKGRAVSFA